MAAAMSAGAQHYCLRWNNYQSNLTSVFDQLLQSESFVDVTLAVAGRSLRAHKVILSASSPYFQSLLHDNPCQHPIIVIDEVAFADMQAVVQFMYKGEINVAEQQLPSLLKVAETLKIRGLADVPDGQALARRATPDAGAPPPQKRRRPSGDVAPSPPTRGVGTPELLEPATEPAAPAPAAGWGAARGPPPAARPGTDDAEIRPAIAEMIKEEERAKMMETTTSWNTPPETTFQHQLQQAWQKSWNQQQSLLQNLRFRERGPLKSWRPETMAAAIMSVLREGHSLSQAARTYDIPYPTFVLYANRVHNLLGPSQEGPGGIPNDLRPKGRGRPQRILLGTWPEETVNNVIRAVVFRDTSGLKEQMENKAAAAAAAAAVAAGHSLSDIPVSISKMMMHQPNGRPPFPMAAPSVPRGPAQSLPSGGHHPRAPMPPSMGQHQPTPPRGRPPNLLGFPDMHMMMGLFPPGMMSSTGAVPTINLPPLIDQKAPVMKTSAGPSPPTRPVPALSSINGPPGRTDSADAETPSGDRANEACLLEPLQEMTEGDEPLQMRRDLDGTPPEEPATADSSAPFRGAQDGPSSTQRPQDSPTSASKMINHTNGRPPFPMAAPSVPRGPAQSLPGVGHHPRAPMPPSMGQHQPTLPRGRPPNLLGFPDMHMMMGLFPPGMLSSTGAVPTINLPPLVDQKQPAMKTAADVSPCRPEVAISSINGPPGRTDSTNAETPSGDRANEASLLEPLQEMTEGDEPLRMRRDLDGTPPEEPATADRSGSFRGTQDGPSSTQRPQDAAGMAPKMAESRAGGGAAPAAPQAGGGDRTQNTPPVTESALLFRGSPGTADAPPDRRQCSPDVAGLAMASPVLQAIP